MKTLKALCLLGLLLPAYALAQVVYPYFSPGGALSGTGTSQNVNVGAGAPFIAGQLPESNTALAVKPAVTVVATSNQTLAGLPTVDGQATAAGSVILNTAQSTGADNGPWVAAAGAWSRPTWYASGSTTQAFQFITTFVRLGTLYQGTTWRLTTPNPITVGTTATTWAETPLALNAASVTGSLPVANGGTGGVAIPTPDNPTATAGLTPVNGSAGTYLRSDGAPALDLTIVPGFSSPWTGAPWMWSNAEPRQVLYESDQGADLKAWDWDVQGAVLTGRTRTDADGAGTNWLSVTRGSTTAISNISLGNATNNPTFNFLGSGLTTFTGTISVGSTTVVTAHRYLASDASFPDYRFTDTSRGADLKSWDIFSQTGHLTFETATDAFGAGKNFLDVVRGTTTAIASMSFGNATDNPTYTFLGTGTVTFNSGTSSPFGGIYRNLTVTGGTLAQVINGVNLSSASTTGIVAGSTQAATFSATVDTLLGTTVALPNIPSSSAATTGTLCWTTGTGLVNVDTTTTCLLSTARVKRDIRELDAGLAEVMQLHPVSYELKPQYDPGHLGRQVGLISEEVGALDSRLISREKDGAPLGVRYQQLTAVLVKAIQEQQHQIDQLRKEMTGAASAHHPRGSH